MIYVFEDGAVVYDGNTISEEEKQEAVAIEVLPEPEKIEGKIAVLRANKAENRVYYEYMDEPKLEPTLEDIKRKQVELERTVAILFEMMLGGEQDE